MSNLLVIKAHPLTATESRSLAILDTFVSSYKENQPESQVTILDIFEEEIPEIDKALFEAWGKAASNQELSAEESAKLTRFNELTEQFVNADKIVIANALWNLNIPTRLKAWIDTVVVKGKTFKYSETGPVGLATDKKLLHIQSNGGSFHGSDPATQYIKTIFGFMGVTDINHIFIEGVDHQPENAETIIAAAKEEAVKLAKVF
ncbi:FMN-dependent NADH-azoreductase [Vagococcus hydrophili]|uniref:FMN dependent NADH:quinone oxidoreductase n=1 Tax=Vagococcus hydrophili TaxID=2714947 RepID=A0A6G8AV58_9ENTE|nr:FMN-dependent NADH-azoreductase [Vagococcus hydrophili]QIL48971.1 FMN-dependent NADH-azoreductase [Vagococcus hydrophili]